MLYNSVAINISNPQSQLNHTAHFDDLKQKNWWFEIGDLVGDFTKKLVTRMDGAPNLLGYGILLRLRWWHSDDFNMFLFWRNWNANKSRFSTAVLFTMFLILLIAKNVVVFSIKTVRHLFFNMLTSTGFRCQHSTTFCKVFTISWLNSHHIL